jgi:hypothetical protein
LPLFVPCAQAAEAAEAAAVTAGVEADLAATLATADALTLRSRGGAALHVYFGAPWFVTRAHRRLPGAPPTPRGATLTPLPAAPALALFGGAPAAAAGGAGAAAGAGAARSGGAGAAADDADDDDEGGAAARCGDAYSLSLATFSWSRAVAAPSHGGGADASGAAAAASPGATAAALAALSMSFSQLPQPPPTSQRGPGRVAHAAAAYFPAPAAACAPGGVLALMGGATSPAPGSALCGADVAQLAASADGTLRWLAPGAGAAGRGAGGAASGAAPPGRAGAAAAASPCGRFIHLFGGADAAGELFSDIACLDVASATWVPTSPVPPSRQRSPGSPGRRTPGSPPPTARRGALGGGGAGLGLSSATPLLNSGHVGWGAPRPRAGAAMAASPDGRTLWLFGGAVAGGVPVNDLYSYDLEAGTWAPREWGAAGAAPGPRTHAALTLEGRYLLLAGGLAPPAPGAPAAALRDAWALDTERLTWECLLRHEDDANAGDAAAAPGAVALAAWRGRTLCLLRGGARGKLDLLETTEFAFPDDIDALITAANAAKRAAARALAAVTGADAPLDDDDDDGGSANGNFGGGGGGGGGGTLRGATLRGTLNAAVPAVSASAALRLYVLAARGATWLDLAWRPPARHSERVAGYKLMLAPAGAATVRCVYSGAATHARVGGLRPGTEYICVVKASYDDGEHVWSDTEAFCTAKPAGGAAVGMMAGRARSPSGGGPAARARTAAPAPRRAAAPRPGPRPSSPPSARGGSPPARRAATAAPGGGSRGASRDGSRDSAAAAAAPLAPPPPVALPHPAVPPPSRGAPPPLQLPADADASFASFGDEGGPVTSRGGAVSRPGSGGSMTTVDDDDDIGEVDAAAAWDAGEADASFIMEGEEEGAAAEEAAAEA